MDTENVPVAKCKTTDCVKSMKNSSHGHCRTHYKMLLAMVKAGQLTWLELEQKGLADPALFTRDSGETETDLKHFWQRH